MAAGAAEVLPRRAASGPRRSGTSGCRWLNAPVAATRDDRRCSAIGVPGGSRHHGLDNALAAIVALHRVLPVMPSFGRPNRGFGRQRGRAGEGGDAPGRASPGAAVASVLRTSRIPRLGRPASIGNAPTHVSVRLQNAHFEAL